MPKFTVRVVLHGNPTRQDYDDLHAQMEVHNFDRFILSKDAVMFELPHAEYDYDGAASLRGVIRLAKLAARSVVGDRFSVLVTQSAGRMWHNLDAVDIDI